MAGQAKNDRKNIHEHNLPRAYWRNRYFRFHTSKFYSKKNFAFFSRKTQENETFFTVRPLQSISMCTKLKSASSIFPPHNLEVQKNYFSLVYFYCDKFISDDLSNQVQSTFCSLSPIFSSIYFFLSLKLWSCDTNSAPLPAYKYCFPPSHLLSSCAANNNNYNKNLFFV